MPKGEPYVKKIIVTLAILTGVFIMPGIKAAEEVVDTIVAVVGDEIILLTELQKQVNSQMMARNLDFNSPRETLMTLRDEVLQGMVDDRLLLMKAVQDTIEIDMTEVDRELKNSVQGLKQRYGSEEAFQQGLEEYGLSEVQLRTMYQSAITKNFLLDRLRLEMTRHISVTPQDMESWIAANRDSLPDIPEKYKISHILVYPEVSETRKQETREKLRDIRARVQNGEDFGELAKQFSEDPGTAANGGFIDWFTVDSGYDQDFTGAAFALQKGEVSDIVETIYGYHLIKCDDIRGNRIQARHILFRLAPNETDEEEVIRKLKDIRQKITNGEISFEDAAKEYSQDENSGDLGGKLDWITSERGMGDSGIPSFIMTAREMKKDDISEPFKSQFGYHIIKLDNFQNSHIINVRDDRTILENLIRQKKFIEEYNRIISRLRDDTYVDIRLY